MPISTANRKPIGPVSHVNDDDQVAIVQAGTGVKTSVTSGTLLSVVGNKFDTGERLASLNAFGTNPPTENNPPGRPAILARNGMIADAIYGFMNALVADPGQDGFGLKLRLIGDQNNPDVITELVFGRNSTDLDSNGTIILRSLQDVQFVANSITIPPPIANATIDFTTSSGVIDNITDISDGGSGYPPDKTFFLAITGGGGIGGVVQVTTNSLGVVTTFLSTPVRGGIGYSNTDDATTSIMGVGTRLGLNQDGSASLFDLYENGLMVGPSIVSLSSHGSNCDLEVNSGAVLRLQAENMVHISSAHDDVNLTTTRSFNVGVGADINLTAVEIINLAAPAIRCDTPMHGFFGAPPVTQAAASAITNFDDLKAYLQSLGLIGT